MISYPRSYILTEDDFSDDDETLPMIINTRPRLQPMVQSVFPSSSSYRTVVDNEPLVYQRVHSPIYTDYRSYETPVEQTSSSPKKHNVRLPKHTKKLVNRFLNNLENAHDHQVRIVRVISFVCKCVLISIEMEMIVILVWMIVMFVVDFDQQSMKTNPNIVLVE